MGFCPAKLLSNIRHLGLIDNHIVDGTNLVIQGKRLPPLELTLLLNGPDIALRSRFSSIKPAMDPHNKLVYQLLVGFCVISF